MMERIISMLSAINSTLFCLLLFKDMSGKEELRKIRQQPERMNEILLKDGDGNG